MNGSTQITAYWWMVAEKTLIVYSDDYLHNGSLGVSAYMEHIAPLRKRFNDGERTQELYNAIQQLKEYDKL